MSALSGAIVFRVLGGGPEDEGSVMILTASYWTPTEFQMEALGIGDDDSLCPAARHEILAYYPTHTADQLGRLYPSDSPVWADPDVERAKETNYVSQD